MSVFPKRNKDKVYQLSLAKKREYMSGEENLLTLKKQKFSENGQSSLKRKNLQIENIYAHKINESHEEINHYSNDLYDLISYLDSNLSIYDENIENIRINEGYCHQNIINRGLKPNENETEKKCEAHNYNNCALDEGEEEMMFVKPEISEIDIMPQLNHKNLGLNKYDSSMSKKSQIEIESNAS